MVTIICTPDWKRVGLSAEKWSPMSHKHFGGPEYTCASYAKLKVGLLWAIPVTKTRSDWPVGPQFSAQRLKPMTPAHCTLHTVELQVLISNQFSMMAKATFQNLSYLTLLQICQKLKLATPQYATYSMQASSTLVAEQKTGGPQANHSKFLWLQLPKAKIWKKRIKK